jgi:hypothetical protein
MARINRLVHEKDSSEKRYGDEARNFKVSLLIHTGTVKFLKTSPCVTESSMTVAQLARNVYETDK